MNKKTYRILIICAAIVVLISVAIAVGTLLSNHKRPAKDGENDATIQQSSNPSDSTVSSFEIHFFDVGEADAALVECDGHFMLIDGGNPGDSSFLYSYLQQHKIDYLDYIVCSHPHVDHVGGLAGALNYSTVGVAFFPVAEYDSRAFNSFVKYLAAQGKTITVPTAGQTISLGSATVTFIGPVDMTIAEQNENNASLMVRIEYGATSFLFTGDAEKEEELSVVRSGAEIKSTLLKVGHHGSYTSSSEEFLAAVNPEYAVISVGKDNGYGHPHEQVVSRLERFCNTILRTDIVGEIICYSDGYDLTFEYNIR